LSNDIIWQFLNSLTYSLRIYYCNIFVSEYITSRHLTIFTFLLSFGYNFIINSQNPFPFSIAMITTIVNSRFTSYNFYHVRDTHIVTTTWPILHFFNNITSYLFKWSITLQLNKSWYRMLLLFGYCKTISIFGSKHTSRTFYLTNFPFLVQLLINII
jgi:hypothetical protein